MLMIRVGAWTCTIKQISVTQSYSTAQCNLFLLAQEQSRFNTFTWREGHKKISILYFLIEEKHILSSTSKNTNRPSTCVPRKFGAHAGNPPCNTKNQSPPLITKKTLFAPSVKSQQRLQCIHLLLYSAGSTLHY